MIQSRTSLGKDIDGDLLTFSFLFTVIQLQKPQEARLICDILKMNKSPFDLRRFLKLITLSNYLASKQLSKF